MNIVFLILKKDGTDRYIEGHEKSIYSAQNGYDSNYFEISAWDIDESGAIPDRDIENPWVDSRNYAEKRRAAYKAEADKLYIQYRACVEDGDDDATAKAPWTTKRNEIKTKYPKP